MLHANTLKGKQIGTQFLEHSRSDSLTKRRPCFCLWNIIPSLINFYFVSNSSSLCLNSFLQWVEDPLLMGMGLDLHLGIWAPTCITRNYLDFLSLLIMSLIMSESFLAIRYLTILLCHSLLLPLSPSLLCPKVRKTNPRNTQTDFSSGFTV